MTREIRRQRRFRTAENHVPGRVHGTVPPDQNKNTLTYLEPGAHTDDLNPRCCDCSNYTLYISIIYETDDLPKAIFVALLSFEQPNCAVFRWITSIRPVGVN